MTDSNTIFAVALAAIMLASLPAMAMPALAAENSSSDDDRDIVTIDSEHGLASESAVSDYRSSGEARTELTQLDATVQIAKSKGDVGVENRMLPLDVRNNYLRIDYREDFERTLRIHIPRKYMVPYSQAEVGSVTTDDYADFEPVRGGQYLEVVVHVDGKSDIVLPLQRDSSASYRAVEWMDTRIEAITGYTAFSGDEWTHVSGDELVNQTSYELDDVEDPDEMVVQYDAHKEDVDETWLNAPESESDDVGVHVMTRTSGGNETAYLVATAEEPPDVRYKPQADPGDETKGWINDAWEIPSRLGNFGENFADLLPFGVISP